MWVSSQTTIKKQQEGTQRLKSIIKKRWDAGNDDVFHMLEFICLNL